MEVSVTNQLSTQEATATTTTQSNNKRNGLIISDSVLHCGIRVLQQWEVRDLHADDAAVAATELHVQLQGEPNDHHHYGAKEPDGHPCAQR